ncbi:hydrogenase 1 maturation peptidase HyaD [Rhodobacter viridis]|uniref:Hydrogenase expression/formation protein HupD n=1 Tax=Rhodobacter viridis TaxID=1054202 RepID=A0A318TZZ5_9RHOB|nr:HyaD/HybD family hydrogenase maturation endopeptidase [Rhodobacter viridis]PYF10670.1 hydrogenase 1 maturation peptidase HyaD [Rhodobacter viridis]
MPAFQPERVLVLGIGNVLWADEGFGVRCVERMAETHALPANVKLLDGGTQGLYLLPFLEETDALIVFDAVDFGFTPGTLVTMRDDDVPAFMGAKKMSLHQTGFQDVIATAQLMGYCPERMTLIGCQPVELEDYGGSLRPAVAEQIDHAILEAVRELRAWGIEVARGSTESNDLVDPSLARDVYERGRPSEDEACRIGDHRFFPSAAKVRA